MIRNMNGTNGHARRGEEDGVVRAIPNVPVTEERKPYMNSRNSPLQHPGTLHESLSIFFTNCHYSRCTRESRAVGTNTAR